MYAFNKEYAFLGICVSTYRLLEIVLVLCFTIFITLIIFQGQPTETKEEDAPQTHRFSAVIEKIERLYTV